MRGRRRSSSRTSGHGFGESRRAGPAVHASTQQSIASADGAEFARARGATRVVVGRELSTAEIAAVVAHTAAEVECFVHGALCVSWSGQCLSSEAWGGRSANRGQCAQACRLPYEVLVDGAGDQADGAATLNYALSPQDLCGLEDVEALTKAGVHCLKIEGRLKDERYVAATAYRKAGDGSLLDDGFDESLLEFKVGVAVLVRDLDQCAAAVDYALTTPPSDDFAVDEVVLDFLELKGLREAVAAIRSAPGLNVVVAARGSLREAALEKLLALGPDALLARSPGQLRYFAGRDVELRGDFSLNAANALTANDLFDDAAALTRLTPAHDLGGAAVARLARRLTPSRRAKLEAGDSFENCGHVCERHTIHLRDEAGADHVVLADMGCRNTVFNAQAQSRRTLGSWSTEHLEYRVEFVDESPAAVAAVLGAYRDLF
ncbi:collagenase [Aureococcus anophagefferens]|nr:collagenase [Aureococcus anophagefferens]